MDAHHGPDSQLHAADGDRVPSGCRGLGSGLGAEAGTPVEGRCLTLWLNMAQMPHMVILEFFPEIQAAEVEK